MLTKDQLRSKIIDKLRKHKEEKLKQKSKKIKEKLFRSIAFKKAKKIMFYLSFDKEVETQEMIKAAQKKGKIVAVPVCDKNRKEMIPCKIGLDDKLRKGTYGIKEPLRKRPLAIKDIDLVIVPGIAFDKKGNRLGRGKGYYDSFLRRLKSNTATIGVAFQAQIVSSVPTTPYDVAVNKVIFA